MDSLGFSDHNHATCIASALKAAEARCAERGAQLTPTRRRVLEILLEEHRAIGAYDILERLRADGQAAQPPVAYRALDFLVKQGLAHKIERLSAFVACAHPEDAHQPAFLICNACDAVAEAPAAAASAPLSGMADAAGFEIDATVLEATGTCPKCREEEA